MFFFNTSLVFVFISIVRHYSWLVGSEKVKLVAMCEFGTPPDLGQPCVDDGTTSDR